ncbi:S-adenosyl-L-methionine-dependent methyltransferase [Xylariales sp. PMI_506]|nr:S-adenosyl-L-methionine-dependent methyltransferase [Xylariales sp. PMI_506]
MVLDGKLGLAPICGRSPSNVLDVATGTGAWAIDFGHRNPGCQVIGTDLSLIQPLRPQNVQFLVTDSEDEEWLFPFDFDYVHFRNTLTSFNDFSALAKKAYDHIQPGGWIEFQEGVWDLRSPDGTLKGTAIDRWASLALKGLAANGRDIISHMNSLKSHLLEAGFVGVEDREFPIPGNGWVRDDVKMHQMGLLTGSIMLHAIESYRKILEFTNLPEHELDTLIEEAKADIQNPDIHFFIPARCIFGQKPQ